jgi:hypothetical protein
MRYIDADKLTVYFEALAKQAEMEGLHNMAHVHNRCLKIIEDAPTADVVEVRHGYWTFKNTTYCHYGCFCSVCGKKSGIGGIRENQLKPYCPNCGAKMDGERSEGNE